MPQCGCRSMGQSNTMMSLLRGLSRVRKLVVVVALLLLLFASIPTHSFTTTTKTTARSAFSSFATCKTPTHRPFSSCSSCSSPLWARSPKNSNNDDDAAVSPLQTTNATASILATSSTSKQQQRLRTYRTVRHLYVPMLSAFRTVRQFLQTIQWYVVSFGAGAILALAALLLPLLYNLENTNSFLNQPVTLFETILNDLDAGYVEPINSYKLFETGVSAMLQSLDPYTEFENQNEAEQMTESIQGTYGGVGLVISGLPSTANDDNDSSNENAEAAATTTSKQPPQPQPSKGIRVVTALEGYAFDYGMRVGDQLTAVDDTIISETTSVDTVRNRLRGPPGTFVTVSFVRDGVPGVQRVTLPRSVVQLRDVQLATLLGNPRDGIGYIQLTGFAADAGREMRNAIFHLQRAAQDANSGNSGSGLQGLVIDLRGNPGGLLTSAVDVASLLVPKGSDIVSAKGRGFPGIVYRSRVDPILDTSVTKLAVLVNGNTASAAEIVSGAVQDLDVGIIVGSDRTYGKGLVQNVEELPYNTALKFTVAKYYTPSGRCIQGVNYKEGSKNENDGKFIASSVEEKDRGEFLTRTGRVVRDGGGIEADYKVEAGKASPLELILLRSGVMNDFAAEWSTKNELTNKFEVDEATYKSFQAFVNEKQNKGDLALESLYRKPLQDLKKALSASGYKGSEKSVEQLQARILRDIQNDFEKYRTEIKEDISQSILARYLPESMLIERGVQKDPQVQASVQLLASRNQFDNLLAKGSSPERLAAASSLNMAQGDDDESVAVH